VRISNWCVSERKTLEELTSRENPDERRNGNDGGGADGGGGTSVYNRTSEVQEEKRTSGLPGKKRNWESSRKTHKKSQNGGTEGSVEYGTGLIGGVFQKDKTRGGPGELQKGATRDAQKMPSGFGYGRRRMADGGGKYQGSGDNVKGGANKR